MPALILDGKEVSQRSESELSERVAALKVKSDGRTPVLATILVGADPASATYVKMKGNACRRVGMESLAIELPETTRTNDLLREIEQLNQNPDVHGILLQHPVPAHIDERACFDMIALEKDVDGVTCLGFGRMAMGEPAYGCATPQGIMRLLKHYELELEGLHAVVVGRSPTRNQKSPSGLVSPASEMLDASRRPPTPILLFFFCFFKFFQVFLIEKSIFQSTNRFSIKN